MDMDAWRATNDPSLQSDDSLRQSLRHHEMMVANAERRYGHSSLRSDIAMVHEARGAAHPWIEEARERGVTTSRLYDILMSMSEVSLDTLYRCGKRRARHWFSDPLAMMVLRSVCVKKGLINE